MQWLWKIFRRSSPVGSSPQADPEPLPSPVDQNFRPAPWVLARALDQVLDQTSGLEAARDRLLEILCGTGPAEREGAFLACLAEHDWSWPVLERWRETFSRQGRWPVTWRRFPSLAVPHQAEPESVAEAAYLFGYLEQRDLLRPTWPRATPFPIAAEELAAAFARHIPWSAIAESARERFRQHLETLRRNADRERGCLLHLHVVDTAEALMLFLKWQGIGGNRLLSYRLQVTSPEQEVAAHPYRDRFNAGEMAEIPPFFPGDTSRLRLVIAD